MRTYNIHEAKTHLSRLIEMAGKGEPFIIAKAGKPLVRVVPIEDSERGKGRIGFMAGEISIPDDFDQMGANEIEDMFGLKP